MSGPSDRVFHLPPFPPVVLMPDGELRKRHALAARNLWLSTLALVVLVGLPLVVLVLGDGAGAGFVPWLRRACEAVAARAWPIFVGIGLWWTGSALWLAWMTLVLRKAGAALVAKAVPGPDHKPS